MWVKGLMVLGVALVLTGCQTTQAPMIRTSGLAYTATVVDAPAVLVVSNDAILDHEVDMSGFACSAHNFRVEGRAEFNRVLADLIKNKFTGGVKTAATPGAYKVTVTAEKVYTAFGNTNDAAVVFLGVLAGGAEGQSASRVDLTLTVEKPNGEVATKQFTGAGQAHDTSYGCDHIARGSAEAFGQAVGDALVQADRQVLSRLGS